MKFNEKQQKVIMIFGGVLIVMTMVYLYWASTELEHKINIETIWCKSKGYQFNDYNSNTDNYKMCCNETAFNTINCDRISLFEEVEVFNDSEFLDLILPLDKYRQ